MGSYYNSGHVAKKISGEMSEKRKIIRCSLLYITIVDSSTRKNICKQFSLFADFFTDIFVLYLSEKYKISIVIAENVSQVKFRRVLYEILDFFYWYSYGELRK